MDFKKLFNWKFLLLTGVALWLILLLISVIAVLVRVVATILIVLGVVALMTSLFRKKDKTQPGSSS